MNELEERALKIFKAIFTNQSEVELEEGTYRIGNGKYSFLSRGAIESSGGIWRHLIEMIKFCSFHPLLSYSLFIFKNDHMDNVVKSV